MKTQGLSARQIGLVLDLVVCDRLIAHVTAAATHISSGGTVGIGKSPDVIFDRMHPDTSVVMSVFPR